MLRADDARNPTEIGGCPMTQTSELAKDVLKDLITIERTLWENNAEIYHDRYSPEALLIFLDRPRTRRGSTRSWSRRVGEATQSSTSWPRW
jgi:hypothetical protein